MKLTHPHPPPPLFMLKNHEEAVLQMYNPTEDSNRLKINRSYSKPYAEIILYGGKRKHTLLSIKYQVITIVAENVNKVPSNDYSHDVILNTYYLILDL